LHLPLVLQPNNLTCGPADVFCIAAGYHGVGPDAIMEVAAKVRCDEEGTDPRNMVPYFKELGLSARFMANMQKRTLKRLLVERVPMIICIQAYAEDTSVYLDPDSNVDGHFVIPIGFDDDDVFYFMDSSGFPRIKRLTWKQLDMRWHENEGKAGKPEIFRHEAVIVRGPRRRPLYPSHALHLP